MQDSEGNVATKTELVIVRRSRIWQAAENVGAPSENPQNGTVQAALRWRLGKLL